MQSRNELSDLNLILTQSSHSANEITDNNPKIAREHVLLGHNTFYLNQDYPGAIAQYNQALNYCPTMKSIYFYRAQSYSALGNQQKALSDIVTYQKLAPTDQHEINLLNEIQGKIDRANGYNSSGSTESLYQNYALAIDHFSQALSLFPGLESAYLNRAAALTALGYQNEALNDIKTYLKFKPDNQSAINLRNEIQGKIDRANEYNSSGSTKSLYQNYALAIDHFSQALSLFPGLESAYLNRAAALTALGYQNEALNDIKTYLKFKPDNQSAINLQNEIQGKIDRANEYNSSGSTKSLYQNYALAIDHFSQALSLFPGLESAYLNRAAALTALGYQNEALNDIKTYLKFKPDNQNAINRLNEIQGKITKGYGHLRRGSTLYLYQQYQEAIDQFDQALLLIPTEKAIYINRVAAQKALDVNNQKKIIPNYAIEPVKKKKKRHGLNKFLHKVSHSVSYEITPITKISNKINKFSQKITGPIVSHVTKLIAPIVTPVLNQILPALSKVSVALNIVNPILKPLTILAGGGTPFSAVTAIVEEQLSRLITAPIDRTLNRILNPVGAIIGDITASVAPVLVTIQQTQTFINNVGQITTNLALSSAIKQPEKNHIEQQAEQKLVSDIIDQQITSHFTLPVGAALDRVLNPVDSFVTDVTNSISPILDTVNQIQAILKSVNEIAEIPATSLVPCPVMAPENTFRSTISVHSFDPLTRNGFGDDFALIAQKLPVAPGEIATNLSSRVSIIQGETNHNVQQTQQLNRRNQNEPQMQEKQKTVQAAPKQTKNQEQPLKIAAKSKSSKNNKNDSIPSSLQQIPIKSSVQQTPNETIEPSKNQNNINKLDMSNIKAGLKGAGIKLPTSVNITVSIANKLLDPNKSETITDVICGEVKNIVSSTVQEAVITTTAIAFAAALPTPDPFSRITAGFIGGMSAQPMANEISKPFENLADTACRTTLEIMGIDKPQTLKQQTDTVKISDNANSFFTSPKTNTDLDSSSWGMQTGSVINEGTAIIYHRELV